MRIKIIHFKIHQVVPMVEHVNIFVYVWRKLFGPPLDALYHFDVLMRVDERYKETARSLEVQDVVELANGARLTVWSVDRFGIIKAKTTNFIEEDLRDYHPMEMYLVYPRVHGHLRDKAV